MLITGGQKAYLEIRHIELALVVLPLERNRVQQSVQQTASPVMKFVVPFLLPSPPKPTSTVTFWPHVANPTPSKGLLLLWVALLDEARWVSCGGWVLFFVTWGGLSFYGVDSLESPW